jgi:hypothetical protein
MCVDGTWAHLSDHDARGLAALVVSPDGGEVLRRMQQLLDTPLVHGRAVRPRGAKQAALQLRARVDFDLPRQTPPRPTGVPPNLVRRPRQLPKRAPREAQPWGSGL